ncbi:hypothetical protein NP233_g12740 [Leucocoprinus birnbaumii]|uniref:Uncharacterized protein n=1 Tax=Leucocoprinus birnbaumii TaxID=56174 RepID=A0AAD5VI16_9AGAR|nr:hypothetical protein NP233_g12740 [Leucocoprinus birnbaumii]
MESVWATAAGRIAREKKHKNFWPDGICLSLGLPAGGIGMGALDGKERHAFVKAFRDIIVDWPGKEFERLQAIPFSQVTEAGPPSHQPRNAEFEFEAAKLYCQKFFAHFGRAPCIPHLFPGF